MTGQERLYKFFSHPELFANSHSSVEIEDSLLHGQIFLSHPSTQDSLTEHLSSSLNSWMNFPICGVARLEVQARRRLVLILLEKISVYQPHSLEGQPIAQRVQMVDAGAYRVFVHSILVGKFWIEGIWQNSMQGIQKFKRRLNPVIFRGVIQVFVISPD